MIKNIFRWKISRIFWSFFIGFCVRIEWIFSSQWRFILVSLKINLKTTKGTLKIGAIPMFNKKKVIFFIKTSRLWRLRFLLVNRRIILCMNSVGKLTQTCLNSSAIMNSSKISEEKECILIEWSLLRASMRAFYERNDRHWLNGRWDDQLSIDVQSWTGPCITPSPCINVTFPPSTTNNIEIFCTLHAVNNST